MKKHCCLYSLRISIHTYAKQKTTLDFMNLCLTGNISVQWTVTISMAKYISARDYRTYVSTIQEAWQTVISCDIKLAVMKR